MLDIKKTLAKIIARLNPANVFVIEHHAPMGASVTLTTNPRFKEGVYTVTKAGYYPICLAGYYNSWISGANTYVNQYRYLMVSRSVGSATLSLGVANLGTGNVTFKPTVSVLWAKVGGVARKLLKALQSLTSERRWAVC